MHFAIRYLTEYRYDGPVTDNLNALRVTPATTATQRVDDFGVRVEPQTRLHQHLDYYGTSVIEFGIAKPHDSLKIDVRARVATAKPPDPPAGDWPALEGDAYRTRAIEFLLPYAGEPDDLRIDELVGLVRADTPLGTLERVVQVIPDRFEYRAGVTYVGSKVEDLLDAGAGVCQDFAHLALVLLRRNGIAARYVSGYLFVPPEGREDADSAEVETHAWLEALVPPGRERRRGAVGRHRPHQPLPGRGALREDRPRPPLPRRAADQGRLPRHRHRGAGCVGADAPHRRGRARV